VSLVEQPDSVRFAFGENWQRFLTVLDEDRISEAERSFKSMLGHDRLDGLRFLDIGSGSGLSSLVAIRLGAERVHSFDFDPQSVACTIELKRRFFPDAAGWTIEAGDASDELYMRSLGEFDVVYAWGVLHHTGEMWTSLEHACSAVAPGGRLWISIYNDQGLQSRIWRRIKRTYNRLRPPFRLPFLAVVSVPLEVRSLAAAVVAGEPARYVHSWKRPRVRGMSRWHDLVDWVGGYPFEVARPEQVFEFCKQQGFRLERLVTAGGGLGCNQFVFERDER
jgi:SAM-dependent methyltransferase